MSKLKQFFSKKRIIVTVVICVLIIACVGGGLFYKKTIGSYNSDAIMGEEVQALPLAMQDLSDSINVTGKVESQNILAVTSDLQASIETLNVSLGQRVNVGDVLCTFNADEVKEQIDTLQKQVSQGQRLEQLDNEIRNREYNECVNAVNTANASLNSINEAIAVQEAIRDNTDNPEITPDQKQDAINRLNGDTNYVGLYNERSNAQEALTNAKATLQAKKDEIDRANLNVVDNSETQKTLNDLKRQLDKTSLSATQSGIVTQLNVSKGSIPQGTIMQIEDDQNLRISVSIREQDIMNLKEGMKAVITSDVYPDEEFSGTVSQVINFASVSSAPSGDDAYNGGGGSGYSAYIDLDPGTPLLLGMSVKVSITFKELGQSLCVPYDSIIDEGDGNPYVYRAVATDTEKFKIEKVVIKTGESNDFYTEIISKDLVEGDYIISNPWMVMEGDEVEISISGGYDMTDDISTDEAVTY